MPSISKWILFGDTISVILLEVVELYGAYSNYSWYYGLNFELNRLQVIGATELHIRTFVGIDFVKRRPTWPIILV